MFGGVEEAGMKKWLSRGGRLVGMGLAWGAAWAPVALLVALIVDPNDSMDEPWLLVGMLPGLLCGAVFSAVSGMADGRHGLDGLTLGRSAVLGVASGLLVGGFWLALAVLSDPPRWSLYGVVIGSLIVMSAVSGAGVALLTHRRQTNARPLAS